MKTKTILTLVTVLLLTAGTAFADLNGPATPPVGDTTMTWSSSGISPGHNGGLRYYYGDFDWSVNKDVYWGPLSQEVKVALDYGFDYGPGDILSLSNWNASTATWTGSTPFTYQSGSSWPTVNLNTRFTITLAGYAEWLLAGSVPYSGLTGDDGVVADVNGDFTAHLLAEAQFPSYGWRPISVGFDSFHTVPNHHSRLSLDTGFWAEPVPSPSATILATLGLSFVTLGRRRIR